jgi:hypothetical protein
MSNKWMAVAAVVFLAATSAAQAKIITFDFSGELFGGPGTDGPANYSGQYSFEDTQPNASELPNEGDYLLKSMTFDVGSTHLRSSLGTLVVLKDQRLQEDVYLVGASFGTGEVSLNFIYDSLNVFRDVSLPLTPPPLTDFDTLFPTHITVAGLPGFDGLQFGSVTSLTCRTCDDGNPTTTVPEPATWSLAGIASVALLAFWVPRRRRKANDAR